MEKEKVVQEKEIRFTGLSRSGNHAIINWVIRQIDGRYCFLNCTEPKHNPFLTARPLWEEDGQEYDTNVPEFSLAQEQEGKFSAKDHLLYSHEDIFLGTLNHKVFRNNHDEWVGQSRDFKDVLILRDPFNLFASRIKSGLMWGHFTHHGTRPISTKVLIRLYKQHAREFLGEKKNLKEKVCINYNSWASSAAYRKEIAGQLEIPFSDKGIEEVSKVAGGSSFDGTKLSGKASSMKLHCRWKEFADDRGFWDLFDDELLALTVAIFGEIPAVQYYQENFRNQLEEA